MNKSTSKLLKVKEGSIVLRKRNLYKLEGAEMIYIKNLKTYLNLTSSLEREDTKRMVV